MSKHLQPLLVILATAGVLVFNWLASRGILGDVETGTVSDRYPTPLTPADYAFSIWALIYAGLVVFTIYQALPRHLERFRAIRTLYILNAAANCAWLYFWHHRMIPASLTVMLVLFGTLLFINIRLRTTESLSEYWLVKVPFEIYFGWVTVAALANAAVTMAFLDAPLSASSWTILAAISLGAAAALGVFLRIKLGAYFYPLTVAWALTAIAIKQSGATAIVVTAAVAVSACLLAAVSVVIKKSER